MELDLALNRDVKEKNELRKIFETGSKEEALATQLKLNSKQRMVMFLLASGSTGKDIAEQVGISEASVSLMRNSELFKEEYAKLTKALEERVLANMAEQETITIARGMLLKEAAGSVEKLIDLRDSAESEQVQLAASKDLLDRSGLSAKKEDGGRGGVSIYIDTASPLASVVAEATKEEDE